MAWLWNPPCDGSLTGSNQSVRPCVNTSVDLKVQWLQTHSYVYRRRGLFFFLFIFYCAGSLLLRGLFFSYRGRGLLSLQWLLFMWNTGSRAPSFSSWGMSAQYICGSWVLEHRLCCSAECGIFLDQGSNPCLLPWQADSLPLSHKGSPRRGSWRESWILTWLPEPFIQLCNLRIMPGVSFSLISVTQSIGIFLDHFIS